MSYDVSWYYMILYDTLWHVMTCYDMSWHVMTCYDDETLQTNMASWEIHETWSDCSCVARMEMPWFSGIPQPMKPPNVHWISQHIPWKHHRTPLFFMGILQVFPSYRLYRLHFVPSLHFGDFRPNCPTFSSKPPEASSHFDGFSMVFDGLRRHFNRWVLGVRSTSSWSWMAWRISS